MNKHFLKENTTITTSYYRPNNFSNTLAYFHFTYCSFLIYTYSIIYTVIFRIYIILHLHIYTNIILFRRIRILLLSVFDYNL